MAIPPILAVVWGVGASALAFIVLAGLLVVFLSRLDEIEIFEVLTLKIKLQRELTLAQQTTEQLRQLAVTLAAPVISEMAVQGTWLLEVPYNERLRMVHNIIDLLRSISVPENEIDNATAEWKRTSRFTICRAISEQISQQRPHEDKGDKPYDESQKKLRIYGQPVTRSEIEEFSNKSRYEMISSELAFWLSELDYFDANGKVRSPERFNF